MVMVGSQIPVIGGVWACFFCLGFLCHVTSEEGPLCFTGVMRKEEHVEDQNKSRKGRLSFVAEIGSGKAVAMKPQI
jgi:hypothetical protein